MHEIKALTSFSGIVSMRVGETRHVDDDAVVADLLNAGYVEEIGKPAEPVEAEEPAEADAAKPTKGRTEKTATETEE